MSLLNLDQEYDDVKGQADAAVSAKSDLSSPTESVEQLSFPSDSSLDTQGSSISHSQKPSSTTAEFQQLESKLSRLSSQTAQFRKLERGTSELPAQTVTPPQKESKLARLSSQTGQFRKLEPDNLSSQTDAFSKLTWSSALTPVDQPSGSLYPVANGSFQTGEIQITFPHAQQHSSTTSTRMPIVIPGKAQKRVKVAPQSNSPLKGRMATHATVSAILIGIVVFLFAFGLPVDTHGQSHAFSLINSIVHLSPARSNAASLIAAQAATATAVTQDGYEQNGAGGNQKYADVNTTYVPPAAPVAAAPVVAPTAAPVVAAPVAAAPAVSSSNFSDPFTAGQCTYWADYRYHQLTGYAVTWTGNADVWGSGAAASGWAVSSSPHLYSIIVLQPGVQYAGSFGHVAVVEKINSDGSVYTSNWNWTGAWMQTTYVTFYPGSGVQFIWHP